MLKWSKNGIFDQKSSEYTSSFYKYLYELVLRVQVYFFDFSKTQVQAQVLVFCYLCLYLYREPSWYLWGFQKGYGEGSLLSDSQWHHNIGYDEQTNFTNNNGDSVGMIKLTNQQSCKYRKILMVRRSTYFYLKKQP